MACNHVCVTHRAETEVSVTDGIPLRSWRIVGPKVMTLQRRLNRHIDTEKNVGELSKGTILVKKDHKNEKTKNYTYVYYM